MTTIAVLLLVGIQPLLLQSSQALAISFRVHNNCLLPQLVSHADRAHSQQCSEFKDRRSDSNLNGKRYDLNEEEDDDSEERKVPRDMRYIEYNILRQHENFVAIRKASNSAELTNDVYVRDPSSDTFWFAGKVARVSDVTLEQAIARQWPLIEQHAARLRPLELYTKRGTLEIWTAPGDSELEVAYNRPHLQFQKMYNNDTVTVVDAVRSFEIGFQGEIYQQGEDGFRTWRTNDGFAARPETTPANNKNNEEKGTKRSPTDLEMKEIQDVLKGKDLNAMFDKKN